MAPSASEGGLTWTNGLATPANIGVFVTTGAEAKYTPRLYLE